MSEPTGRAEDIDERLEDDDPETLQDEVSGGMSADDRPEAVESYGVTERETRHGESLAQQLGEETPDVGQEQDPVDAVVADHPELDADADPALRPAEEDGGDPEEPPADDASAEITDEGVLDEDEAAEQAALHESD